MRQRTTPPRVGDMTFLGGWLFADLLLALMVIFFAASLGAPPPNVLPPPILTVNATGLDPKNSACTGGVTNPICTVTLTESQLSKGAVHWSASSDMSTTVAFNPSQGDLSPGNNVTVTISAIPCQTGSFTFTGSRGALPVTVLWKCTPLIVRLSSDPQTCQLTVQDVNALQNGSSQDENIRGQLLKCFVGSQVALAIVYDGAPTQNDISRAKDIGKRIYGIMRTLNSQGKPFERASYYGEGGLYNLGFDFSIVQVDAYLFTR